MEHDDGETERNRFSKKVIAVFIVIILVVSAIAVIWYFFFKPWSVGDLEASITAGTYGSPGFSTSLANKTIRLDGIVNGSVTYNTTKGPLTIVWLKGAHLTSFMLWNSSSYSKGDAISIDVSFIWGFCNDDQRVFSPQVNYPGIGVLLDIGATMDELSNVRGSFSEVHETPDGKIRVDLLNVRKDCSFVFSNCTLRAGKYGGASEYVDLIGDYNYGANSRPPVDAIANLSLSTVGTEGAMTYFDNDSDENVSSGDYILLDGLKKPTIDCAAYTYLLTIGRDFGLVNESTEQSHDLAPLTRYIVMTADGPLSYTDKACPYADLAFENLSGDVKATINFLSRQVAWNNTRIGFFNHGDFIAITAYLPKGCLSDGPLSYYNLSLKRSMDSVDLLLSVVDIEGNGAMDKGDYLIISPRNGTHLMNETELATLAQTSGSPYPMIDYYSLRIEFVKFEPQVEHGFLMVHEYGYITVENFSADGEPK